jgi:hypothetical protein
MDSFQNKKNNHRCFTALGYQNEMLEHCQEKNRENVAGSLAVFFPLASFRLRRPLGPDSLEADVRHPAFQEFESTRRPGGELECVSVVLFSCWLPV